MELYDLASPVENMLAAKADIMRSPLGGTIELLPLCNMSCKMCYIHQSKEQMNKTGTMLSCDQWLRIADEAKKSGVLYLLLTGGEPLLYPEFKRLYTNLTDMGFIITINTNGTLINEEIADLFGKRPCRRLNITLYGKNNESYDNLCGNPNGFSQVMNALNLLNERNVPCRLNCSITPDNIDQLREICEIANERQLHLEAVSYMFPPFRIENTNFSRLTPQEAAQASIDSFIYKNPQVDIHIAAKNTLRTLNQKNKINDIKGMACRAGRSGFWLSWNGNMLPCGMFNSPKISLLEHSFEECWQFLVHEVSKIKTCSECHDCRLRNICKVCAAACLTETGSIEKKPEYLCQMAQSYERLLNQLADQ